MSLHPLLLHSFRESEPYTSGCGKVTALKKATTNGHARKQLQVFDYATPTVVTDYIEEQAIICVYDSNIGEYNDNLE